MFLSAEILRSHLAYTAWASRRIVAAAANLSPEEQTRNFQTADKSILGTLVHVYAADRVWLSRLTGAAPAPFVSEADYQFSVLENDWPALLDRWQKWAQALSDEGTQVVLAYKDTKGNPYSQPIWQLVLHVVNHGTHHRGQVSGFLRALGHTPPPLDLTAYHRELPISGTSPK
jgi:uncharacterized damage-inducible protein DinB